MTPRRKPVDSNIYLEAADSKLWDIWFFRIRDCITMSVRDKKCDGCKNKFRVKSLTGIKDCRNNFDEYNFTPYPQCLEYPH